MKKYLSVFMLYARSTIYKLFLVLTLMAGTQIILFSFCLSETLTASEELYGSGFSFLIGTKMLLPFLAGFLLTAILLMNFGSDWKGKPSYTLRRLCLIEKELFFIQAIYNTLGFFLLYGAEVLITFVCGLLFLRLAPADIVSHQTLFVNYYGNDFLHSLVPLEETTRWIRNFLLLPGLGFVAAWQPYLQRRGKRTVVSFLYPAFIAVTFPASLGAFSNDIVVSAISLIVIVHISYKAMKEEFAYEA